MAEGMNLAVSKAGTEHLFNNFLLDISYNDYF